jgi:hypothetical protein
MSNDDLGEIMENLREAFAKLDEDMKKMADECDNELKIAVTKWVFRKIVEHAQEGGSYRYLIYDRLGFGTEAYAPLCSDGMTISNEFDLNLKDQIVEVAKTEGYDKIKSLVGCCDEPGCYDYISCGWPTEDGGYRQTCSNHYHGKLKSEK